MSAIAVVLVVISAFTHAGWNLLGKRRNPSATFFFVSNTIGTLLLLPLLLWFGPRLVDIPARVWWLLLATGFFQALYYTALAAAYRAGDMSVAYPLARSLPVIFTSAIVVLSGGIGSYSLLYAVGCLLVIFGMLLIPFATKGKEKAGRRISRVCALLAGLAAVGTTGYSLIDSAALASLRGTGRFGTTEAALLYLAAEAVTSTLWMALYILARRAERQDLGRTLSQAWRPALLMALGIYVTYGLVLVAMAFARNVGYIVAFRQLGVPLGAVLAILVFREPAPPLRVAGVAVASVGLLLIALG